MGCRGLNVEGVEGKPNRKGELLSFFVVVEGDAGSVTTGGGLISDISGSFGYLERRRRKWWLQRGDCWYRRGR